MENKQIIYYSFKKLNLHLLINVLLFIGIIAILLKCSCLITWWQTQILIGIFLISCGLWYWLYVIKHIALIIDDESIKLDQSAPIKWKDIKSAEEQNVWCCLHNRKVLTLIPKKNIDYKYNFMQRHNPFPPFSIPLYGILSQEDEDKIINIVSEHVKIKKLK